MFKIDLDATNIVLVDPMTVKPEMSFGAFMIIMLLIILVSTTIIITILQVIRK